MAVRRIGISLAGAFFGLAAVSATFAQPAGVDRALLESLHESGQAFRRALADPNATIGAVDDARQKLEHEAGRLAGRPTGASDKRVVELYVAAAHGYQEARNRFGADHARDRYFADVRQIETELAEADNLFQGGAPIVPAVAAAPPPPEPPQKRPREQTVPVPPSDLAPPAPVPPPMPPAHSPEPPTHATPPTSPPQKRPSQSTPPPPSPAPLPPPTASPGAPTPTPPAATNRDSSAPVSPAPPVPPKSAPPPAPVAPVAPAPPPPTSSVAPPATEIRPVPPPPVAPPEPAAPVVPTPPPPTSSVAPPAVETPVVPPPPAPPTAAAPPPAAVPAPRADAGAAAPSREEPSGARRFPPIVSRAPVPSTPSGVRKAADKVRVEKNAGSVVERCSLLGEVATGDVRSGVHEIGGHNFLYDDALGLARLMTVEAGGDTILVREQTKTRVTGDAYRCSQKP